jgi:hypothetical protein
VCCRLVPKDKGKHGRREGGDDDNACFEPRANFPGNTVYFGLGASGQPVSQPWRWAKSGVSILSFMLGSFAFSRFMRAMGPRRRGVIIFCLALQALLTFGAALSATTGLVPPDAGNQLPHNWIVLFPLAMLSAQAGGQCVLSRALGYNEMPSVVLTSAYCDLVMDPQIFSSITANAKRNRRVASALMILAGAAIGGFMTKDTDIGPALWLGSALKTVMAASWLFWKAEEGQVRLP